MLISVDFWKSMHGFAMDSRTRVRFVMGQMKLELIESGELDQIRLGILH